MRPTRAALSPRQKYPVDFRSPRSNTSKSRRKTSCPHNRFSGHVPNLKQHKSGLSNNIGEIMVHACTSVTSNPTLEAWKKAGRFALLLLFVLLSPVWLWLAIQNAVHTRTPESITPVVGIITLAPALWYTSLLSVTPKNGHPRFRWALRISGLVIGAGISSLALPIDQTTTAFAFVGLAYSFLADVWAPV